MRHDFTPRRIGEILDDAILLVRSNFRTIGPVTAVAVLPVAAAYSVVVSFYIRTIFEVVGRDFASAAAGSSTAPDLTFVLLAALMQGLGLLYMGARTILEGTVYSNSAQLLERRPVPLKEALRGGMRSFVYILVLQFIAAAVSGGIVFVIAMVLVVISIALVVADPVLGGVALGVSYAVALIAAGVVTVLLSLAAPIVVIEGGIGNAVKRSVSLVRRHFWRMLLILLAAGLLVAQFESALAAPTIVREIVTGVQSPAALFREIAWGWKAFDGLVQGIAIAVVLPFSASVTLLAYLDLRARDEGMDLLIRARELLAA